MVLSLEYKGRQTLPRGEAQHRWAGGAAMLSQSGFEAESLNSQSTSLTRGMATSLLQQLHLQNKKQLWNLHSLLYYTDDFKQWVNSIVEGTKYQLWRDSPYRRLPRHLD